MSVNSHAAHVIVGYELRLCRTNTYAVTCRQGRSSSSVPVPFSFLFSFGRSGSLVRSFVPVPVSVWISGPAYWKFTSHSGLLRRHVLQNSARPWRLDIAVSPALGSDCFVQQQRVRPRNFLPSPTSTGSFPQQQIR